MRDALPNWKTMNIDDRLSSVRAMAAEGLSAGMIAMRFDNATRMSVVSLCHRKNIQLHGRLVRTPGPRPKPAPKPTKTPKVETPPFETAPLPEEELGNDVGHLIGIMDLKADSCRYMFGDPKGQHGYCGKTTKGSSSWCPEHQDIVFGGRS